MDNSPYLLLPILLPLGTAFILPFVDRMSHWLRTAICVAAMAVSLAILVGLAGPVFDGETLVYWMSGWTPRDGLAIGISLSVDAWSLLIALVVAFIGLMALIYTTVYLRSESGKQSFYVLTMLLLAALTGFCLSGDLFNQFVWLEVFSVASFALTGFHFESPGSVEAAFKYLVTNSLAAFFIVIGLTLLYMQTGALNLAHVARDFQPTTAGVVAIGLLVGGYATKAALVPWHFWLPDAHTVAPTPIHAIFSGALIKVGIYAVARSIFTIMPFESGSIIQTGLLIIAGINMLVGGIQMVQQQPIKRILAYSSVSQMGYIVLGLALGTPLSIAAAGVHIASHALVKTALLLGAGMVTWRTGIHDIREGGGLIRRMPVTFALMCVAGLSLAGLPLLSGYVSKTLLEEAADSAGFGVLAVIAVVSSVLTFMGIARLIWCIFLAKPAHNKASEASEAPFQALLPMTILVGCSVLIGLFPSWMMEHVTQPASAALLDRQRYIAEVLTGESATESPEAVESEKHHVPAPLDVQHWGIPAVVVLLGAAGTVLLVRPQSAKTYAWMRPLQGIARLSREWHTGLITDYVLWNAFGTAGFVFLLALADRIGFL